MKRMARGCLFAVGAVLVLTILGAMFNGGGDSTGTPDAAEVADVAPTEEPTDVPATPRPTRPPRPTATEVPTVAPTATMAPDPELDAWAAEYLVYAQENMVCCVDAIRVTQVEPIKVEVAVTGEMATRPEEARQMLANGLANNLKMELDRCLAEIAFDREGGNIFTDVYTTSGC